MGQLPKSLRTDVKTMWIHKGEEAWGGGNNNILTHTGQGEIYENWNGGDISQETLIHEGTHTSLDSKFTEKMDGLVRLITIKHMRRHMQRIIRNVKTLLNFFLLHW